ncbi:hypothetical protein BGW42_007889 [Actinomortierella wolfii]|nr:hypothetical protein BGW42_007889 [Actinomortierella wolfii]
MVYATRSRVLAQRRGAAGGTVSTARVLGESKETPRKRRSSTHLESVTITKKPPTPAARTPRGRSTKKGTATTTTTSLGRRRTAVLGASKATKKTASSEASIKEHHLSSSSFLKNDQHHIRFKDYDAIGDNSSSLRQNNNVDEMEGKFVPSVQSNRDSRRESLHPPSSSSRQHQHQHQHQHHPGTTSDGGWQNSGIDADRLASVSRTHLHFSDNNETPERADYMSGELSREDDCVPTALKRSRTMLETFEEGREFLGRDWHFEGEGDECGHQGRAHRQEDQVHKHKHKHKHKHLKHKNNDAHNSHLRSENEGEAVEVTHHVYNTRSRGPVEDSAIDNDVDDGYIQSFDRRSSLPDSSSAPVYGWKILAAFSRLSSFFATKSSLSKDESMEDEETEHGNNADVGHAVETVEGLNHHIRWPENESDVESSETMTESTPGTPRILRSALKRGHKTRLPGRHVTYQDEVMSNQVDNSEANTAGLSQQGDAAGSSFLWPLNRLGSVFRHLRGNQSTHDDLSTSESSSSLSLSSSSDQSSRIHETMKTSSTMATPTTLADINRLEKLIHEKEKALHTAEMARSQGQRQVVVRTKELTREIKLLDCIIQDFRSQLAQKDQDLSAATQLQFESEDSSIQKQVQLPEDGESSTIVAPPKLKGKESAERDIVRVRKLLEQANHERSRLLTEIHELKQKQNVKISELTSAQSSLQALERHTTKESQQAQVLGLELEQAEQELENMRQQLQQALEIVQRLSAAEARAEKAEQQLLAAKEEIKSRESYMRALEKTNASMGQKSNEADKLAEEIQHLREQQARHIQELNEARIVIDELGGARLRAAVLTDQVADLEEQVARQTDEMAVTRARLEELEDANDRAEELAARVIDLQDQVNVEEKHLTYLENKMLEHENCLANAQELADHIEELEEQLDTQKKEIRRLQGIEQQSKKQNEQIVSLKAELQRIREEEQDTLRALKGMRSKYGRETAKLESTANELKDEAETLKQQLQEKTEQLHSLMRAKDQALLEKGELANMIGRLHRELDHKDARLEKLEGSLFRLNQDRDQKQARLDEQEASNSELREMVMELEYDVNHARSEYSKVSKDLAKATTRADQLAVEVASLNDLIAYKEAALEESEKRVAKLEKQSQQTEGLLDQIHALEREAEDNLTRAHIAEKEANELEERANRVHGLQQEIRTLYQRIEELQKELDAKEKELAALQKVAKQHEAAKRQVHELKAQMRQLKDQLGAAQSQAKESSKAKEIEIQTLKDEIQAWIEHEAEWIQRTTELTNEVNKIIQIVHKKDRQLEEITTQLHRQESEVDRLKLERKRQNSEAEDRFRHKMRKLEREKQALSSKVDRLEGEAQSLTQLVGLQRDHEAQQLELHERIRELLLWRENSIAQTREWEITVSNLENDKSQLAKELVAQEALVNSLLGEVSRFNEWHQIALDQAAHLANMVEKFEKELARLHHTLAEHDGKDASLHVIMDDYKSQIAKLESAQASLHEQLRKRDTTIRDLEVRLRQEIQSYKNRLVDARREGEARDLEISRLQSLVIKQEKTIVGYNERARKDQALLTSLQTSSEKQAAALQEQIDRYDDLHERYKALLQQQTTRDRQVARLEKQLVETTSNDSDRMIEQQAHIRQLEKNLATSQSRISHLEIELHKAATNYHDTMILLEETRERMKSMIPAADANHDDCISRIKASEQEAKRLAREVENLEDRILVLSREAQVKAQAWAKAEAEFKDRIETLTQSQRDLEARALEAQKDSELKVMQRDQDRLRLAEENAKNGELIQQLRRSSIQWEKGYSEMETRMRHELSSTLELVTKLVALRRSMVHDNQTELRALDDLEQEIKQQAVQIKETITLSRSRLDSGAFLDASSLIQVHQEVQPHPMELVQ